MKKKKVWIWLTSIIVVLAITGSVTWWFLGKNITAPSEVLGEMSIPVQKASEEVLAESILVTGKIVPEGEQKIFLDPEKGEVSEYKVKENQKVKAGEVLFLYDSSKLEVEFGRAIRERDLILRRGKTEQSQIAEMDKRIKSTKNKVGTKKSTEEDAEFETSVTQEDVNQLLNEKVELEIQYESTKSEISSAQEQINELDAQVKDMTVVSKIDGLIVKIDQNVAKTETGSTDPVMHIISSGPFKVIGTMSEFDTVKIQPDQAVIIRPKVFKDQEWNGVVESVSQFPNDEGGDDFAGDFGGDGSGNVTMYPFKVGITDDTSELRQGFHVSLEINVGGEEKSLVIPHLALLDQGDMAVVFVLVDGLLESREVQTGAMNDEFIEIVEGIELGELVVIEPNEEMYDGMEVSSFDEIE